MKIRNSLLLSLFFSTCFLACGQSKMTLTQKLDYDENDKLLIIHADDIGVAHSENQASFDALEKGMVNSGSVMVPCPWFLEVVDYYKKHPELDLGIHLTLTAEWKNYKWQPAAPCDKVQGLVNEQGYLYDNCQDVIDNATAEEVEIELRAQIDRAIAHGIQPTHLDTHMGCLANPKFIGAYLKMGEEYNIPVMLTKGVTEIPNIEKLLTGNEIIIDGLHMASPKDFEAGMADFYSKTLKSLTAGVNVILIHTAYDEAEMQAVTIDHPDYGAAWRQADFDFFTSDECKKILKEERIKLIQWKDLGKLMEK